MPNAWAPSNEVIARWEGGKVMPSTRTLARLAKATGTRLQPVIQILERRASSAPPTSEADPTPSQDDVGALVSSVRRWAASL